MAMLLGVACDLPIAYQLRLAALTTTKGKVFWELPTEKLLDLVDDLDGKVGIARMLFMHLCHQLNDDEMVSDQP